MFWLARLHPNSRFFLWQPWLLRWPLWCLWKDVSWPCMQHLLAQPPTPTKEQADSHGGHWGAASWSWEPGSHPFLGLLQNGNLRKQLLLIGQENYILIGCLLTLQCNFWSQQNVESLERWCCVPKCGVSLVRRITGKGRATWAMLLDPFRTPSFINCGTHQLLLPFGTCDVTFLFTQEEGPTWFILWRGRKGRKNSMWEPRDPKLGPTFVHLGCWNSRVSV